MLCAICKSSKYMQNMSIQSQNNKRLAKNTLILYARMLFTVGISFYSTRLILANLGVSDYGVYNVIGGFVSMFYMVYMPYHSLYIFVMSLLFRRFCWLSFYIYPHMQPCFH